MTEAASSAPAELSEIEKTAIVIMSIGQDSAAQVVKHLSQPEISRLSAAMARISTISRSTAATVMQEFAELMRQESTIGIDGEDYLHGVLEKALGAEKAATLFGGLKRGDYASGIEAVKWQDPRDLAEMIKSEHPQIVAMIAAHLEPGAGAAVNPVSSG